MKDRNKNLPKLLKPCGWIALNPQKTEMIAYGKTYLELKAKLAGIDAQPVRISPLGNADFYVQGFANGHPLRLTIFDV